MLHQVPQLCRFLTEVDESLELVECLKQEEHRQKVIAIDIKGHDMLNKGPISLVTVATCGGHVYMFDLLTTPALLHDGGIKQVIEDENILKVVFDSPTLNQILEENNVCLQNCFDVQLAVYVIEKQSADTEIELRTLYDVDVLYGCHVGTVAKHAWQRLCQAIPLCWNTRPLCHRLLDYAVRDVVCLVPELFTSLCVSISDPVTSQQYFEAKRKFWKGKDADADEVDSDEKDGQEMDSNEKSC